MLDQSLGPEGVHCHLLALVGCWRCSPTYLTSLTGFPRNSVSHFAASSPAAQQQQSAPHASARPHSRAGLCVVPVMEYSNGWWLAVVLTLILGQPAPLPAGALLQLGFCGRRTAQRHMQGVHAGCIKCKGSVWGQLAPLIAKSLLRQRCHNEGHPAGHRLCLGCTSCSRRVERL